MSVFLQILYHSSVSWKIIPLNFYGSNIIYFGRKEPSANFYDFWMFGLKFIKFLMSIIKQQVDSSLNFLSFFTVSVHKSSVNF